MNIEEELGEYEVKKIIDSWLKRGKLQYLIKWKNYPIEESTWEYQLKGKGVKALVTHLSKTQNVALRWLTGAFRTNPVVLLEFLSGIAPVHIRLDFQLKNFLARGTSVPSSHLLRVLATRLWIFSSHATLARQKKCSSSNNIKLLCSLFKELPAFPLFAPLLRLGHRVSDLYPHRLSINVPAHPKKGTALFDQWLASWLQNTEIAINSADFSIGTDASFTGQNIATIAFVVQQHRIDVHQHIWVCSAHSVWWGAGCLTRWHSLYHKLPWGH